jgi:hypothetical protein
MPGAEEEEEVAAESHHKKPMMDVPYICPVRTIDMGVCVHDWLELKYHYPTACKLPLHSCC